jgi:hypothetical protein
MSAISLSTSSSLSLASSPSLRLGTRVTNALNGAFVFNLFDDAIADLLCVHTYTHGTSPKCYNSIMKIGADPTRGGKGGESGLYEAFGTNHDLEVKLAGKESGWNCKGRFFVFPHQCPELIKRWQPRLYAIAACIGENCTVKQSKLEKGVMMVASFFQGFCSPVLKFRFLPDEAVKFKGDETFSDHPDIGAFTEHPISPDHIGLYGSIYKGVNADWKNRIQQHPGQFVKGLLKLTASVALVVLAIFGAMSYASVAIALTAYVAVKTLQIVGRFFVPLYYERNYSGISPSSP